MRVLYKHYKRRFRTLQTSNVSTLVFFDRYERCETRIIRARNTCNAKRFVGILVTKPNERVRHAVLRYAFLGIISTLSLSVIFFISIFLQPLCPRPFAPYTDGFSRDTFRSKRRTTCLKNQTIKRSCRVTAARNGYYRPRNRSKRSSTTTTTVFDCFERAYFFVSGRPGPGGVQTFALKNTIHVFGSDSFGPTLRIVDSSHGIFYTSPHTYTRVVISVLIHCIICRRYE